MQLASFYWIQSRSFIRSTRSCWRKKFDYPQGSEKKYSAWLKGLPWSSGPLTFTCQQRNRRNRTLDRMLRLWCLLAAFLKPLKRHRMDLNKSTSMSPSTSNLQWSSHWSQWLLGLRTLVGRSRPCPRKLRSAQPPRQHSFAQVDPQSGSRIQCSTKDL